MLRINNKKGFTLVELLVVITIVGILAALLSMSFITTMKRQRVDKAKEDLMSFIQEARNRTVSGANSENGAKCYGLRLTEEELEYKKIIYNTYDEENDLCGSETEETVGFPGNIQIFTTKIITNDAEITGDVKIYYVPPTGKILVYKGTTPINDVKNIEIILGDKREAVDSIFTATVGLEIETGRIY